MQLHLHRGACGSNIQQLVIYFLGCDHIEEFHDSPGEVRVRRAPIGNDDTGVGPLFGQHGPVKIFEIGPVVSQDRALLLSGRSKVRSVGCSELTGISGGKDVEPMSTEQLTDQDGDIFVEVESNEEMAGAHRRRGSIFSSGTRFWRISRSISSLLSM